MELTIECSLHNPSKATSMCEIRMNYFDGA